IRTRRAASWTAAAARGKRRVAVCLVTGSSRGFGRLICRRLAAGGHRVYASMRDPSGPGAELADACEAIELDVTDAAAAARAVELVVDREGRLDAVVNNAGYVLWGPVEEASLEQILRQFDVNVFGALRVVQAAAPVLRRQGAGVV